jgi:hypothetical protein
MIRRSAGRLGLDTVEPKLGKIEFVYKDVDHPNRIVLADPVFQAFRKQRALPAIRALNEASHPIPRKSRGNHIARIKSGDAFLHNQGLSRHFDRGSATSGLPI